MTEKERLQKQKEEEERRRTTKQDYNRVLTEDGTLASFNFNDNYKSSDNK